MNHSHTNNHKQNANTDEHYVKIITRGAQKEY